MAAGSDDHCSAPDIDIDRKVAFLGSAKAYAEQPTRVERIETHFSWVFLTEKHVYKLKKPLRDGGVDFSSLDARRRNADQEVSLNRRLAPDVYVGVVPLALDKDRLAIAGAGPTVDWLVQMRRLPAEWMLDYRIAHGDWRYAEIEALAARLASFFATARCANIEPKDYIERLRAECRLSWRAFREIGGPALRHPAVNIARRLDALMHCRRELLLSRAAQGRVVQGHGDLRPEHICLAPAPIVIDCLEFRADLRSLDPVDELAFLAMECTKLGAPSIARLLFYRYSKRTGDDPPRVLIALYGAINALIRARIAILHLLEWPVRDPRKWPKRAAEYLMIAGRAVQYVENSRFDAHPALELGRAAFLDIERRGGGSGSPFISYVSRMSRQN